MKKLLVCTLNFKVCITCSFSLNKHHKNILHVLQDSVLRLYEFRAIVPKLASDNAFSWIIFSLFMEKQNIFSPIFSSEFVVKCGNRINNMVLGSFQCRGVLLLLHKVGQAPAVLAAGAGWLGYILYNFRLSSLSNVLSFGRRLNMTEILWFRLLNSNGSCQLLPRTSSLSTD